MNNNPLDIEQAKLELDALETKIAVLKAKYPELKKGSLDGTRIIKRAIFEKESVELKNKVIYGCNDNQSDIQTWLDLGTLTNIWVCLNECAIRVNETWLSDSCSSFAKTIKILIEQTINDMNNPNLIGQRLNKIENCIKQLEKQLKS